jgi:hypothetical protein
MVGQVADDALQPFRQLTNQRWDSDDLMCWANSVTAQTVRSGFYSLIDFVGFDAC